MAEPLFVICSASLCGRATRFIGAGRRAAAPAVLDIQTMIWNQFCAVGFTNQHDQVLCRYAAVTANSYCASLCSAVVGPALQDYENCRESFYVNHGVGLVLRTAAAGQPGVCL